MRVLDFSKQQTKQRAYEKRHILRGMTMSPEMYAKLTNGFWGFVLGAGVAMIVGFVWGGWTTSSTTQKMSEEAVLTSRAAICVAQFMRAPNHDQELIAFKETDAWKRSELIEKGGWDKMPGQGEANGAVAEACARGIEVLATG